MKPMETSENNIPETMKKLGFRLLTFRTILVMYNYYMVVVVINLNEYRK